MSFVLTNKVVNIILNWLFCQWTSQITRQADNLLQIAPIPEMKLPFVWFNEYINFAFNNLGEYIYDKAGLWLLARCAGIKWLTLE